MSKLVKKIGMYRPAPNKLQIENIDYMIKNCDFILYIMSTTTTTHCHDVLYVNSQDWKPLVTPYRNTNTVGRGGRSTQTLYLSKNSSTKG